MSNRQTVDARDTFCPGPLMGLVAALRASSVGDEIEVLSSDEGSVEDIPAWTRKVGHTLISTDSRDNHFAFVVRKAR
jgi:TusA-related sulfurtransferase